MKERITGILLMVIAQSLQAEGTELVFNKYLFIDGLKGQLWGKSNYEPQHLQLNVHTLRWAFWRITEILKLPFI